MKLSNPPNSLWRLIAAAQWDSAISLLETTNEIRDQAKEKVFRGSYSFYPLHYTLIQTAPEKIVLALLKAYPDAAKHHYEHDLPLHLAIRKRRSIFLIEKITHTYPDSLKKTNNGTDLMIFASKFYKGKKNSKDKKVLTFLRNAAAPPPSCASSSNGAIDLIQTINQGNESSSEEKQKILASVNDVIMNQSLMLAALASLSESKEKHSKVLAKHSSHLLNIKKHYSNHLQNQENILTMFHSIQTLLLTITEKIKNNQSTLIQSQKNSLTTAGDIWKLLQNQENVSTMFVDIQTSLLMITDKIVQQEKLAEAKLYDQSHHEKSNLNDRPCDNNNNLINDIDMTDKEMKENLVRLNNILKKNGIEVPEDIERKLVTNHKSERPRAPTQTSLHSDRIEPAHTWRSYSSFHTSVDPSSTENPSDSWNHGLGSYYDECTIKKDPDDKSYQEMYYNGDLAAPVKDPDDRSYEGSYYTDEIEEERSYNSWNSRGCRYEEPDVYSDVISGVDRVQQAESSQYYDVLIQGTCKKSENYNVDRAEDNLNNESNQERCEECLYKENHRPNQGAYKNSQNYLPDSEGEFYGLARGTYMDLKSFISDDSTNQNHDETSVISKKIIVHKADQGMCKKSEKDDYQSQRSVTTGENANEQQETYHETSSLKHFDDKQKTNNENSKMVLAGSKPNERPNTMQVEHHELNTKNVSLHSPFPKVKPTREDNKSDRSVEHHEPNTEDILLCHPPPKVKPIKDDGSDKSNESFVNIIEYHEPNTEYASPHPSFPEVKADKDDGFDKSDGSFANIIDHHEPNTDYALLHPPFLKDKPMKEDNKSNRSLEHQAPNPENRSLNPLTDEKPKEDDGSDGSFVYI